MITAADGTKHRSALLLRVLAEATSVEGPSVVVTALRGRTGLSNEELITSRRHLKGRGHADAKWALYSAGIDPHGVEALNRFEPQMSPTSGTPRSPDIAARPASLAKPQRRLLSDLPEEFLRTPARFSGSDEVIET